MRLSRRGYGKTGWAAIALFSALGVVDGDIGGRQGDFPESEKAAK
jgi:hypothetical protein